MKNSTTIDIRSDTVTKPTKEMLDAMFQAEVGDDVFEEDPTVKKLEEKSAAMFGKEAALFCTSGTMANQVALNILTQPMQEMICDRTSHIYNHEGGGYAFHSRLSIRIVNGERGRISARDVLENINPNQVHVPSTALVCIENTNNKAGGSCYSLQQIGELAGTCIRNNLKLHLDGARIFNALTATGDQPAEMGKYFDTISFCLSKGLGAPAGSMLLSTKENIKKARRVRKIFGGGMRQVGFLAAAGVYALDHHIGRLEEDHRRAKILADVIRTLPYVEQLLPVETNIVIFRISHEVPEFLNFLTGKNIRAFRAGEKSIRMVTHLDFDDEMLEKVCKVIQSFRPH